MIKLIETILPEAKYIKGGKYRYNDWLICIPCHFVENKKTGKTLRFHGMEQFEWALKTIK